MSPFEVVQAIQSAGVGVVGLDSRRTVVVLQSIDDQDVGETAVIRCPSNQQIRRVPRGESETPPSDVRIGDERAGPPSSPIQTYKQSWISTATGGDAGGGPPPWRWWRRTTLC
jgi:hypothetical protein